MCKSHKDEAGERRWPVKRGEVGGREEGGGTAFRERYVRRNIHAGIHHVTIWAGR